MKRNTSSFHMIDKKVLWTMAACAAISLTVLAFRVKHADPCTTAEISVKPGPLYAGEVIQFRAVGEKVENSIQWEFGDTRKSGAVVSHAFDLPGRYEVLLNSGTKCMGYMTLYVKEAPISVDETLQAVFSGPLTVEVGSPAVFNDETPNASKWEWRFGETNKVDATGHSPTYTFKTEGQKSVILIVNDKLRAELPVLVTPRKIIATDTRENPLPAKKANETLEVQAGQREQPESMEDPTVGIEKVEIRFPDVSLRRLEVILEGIVEGKSEIADLYAYACKGKDMQVTYNGDLISLTQLQRELWEIKSKRKIRSIQITTEKDPLRNCINTMNITLKKKLL